MLCHQFAVPSVQSQPVNELLSFFFRPGLILASRLLVVLRFLSSSYSTSTLEQSASPLLDFLKGPRLHSYLNLSIRLNSISFYGFVEINLFNFTPLNLVNFGLGCLCSNLPHHFDLCLHLTLFWIILLNFFFKRLNNVLFNLNLWYCLYLLLLINFYLFDFISWLLLTLHLYFILH